MANIILTTLLVKTDSGMVLSTDRLGLVPVCQVVANVSERRSPGRFAIARSLQAEARVPGEADIEPLHAFSQLVTAIFSCFLFAA